MIHLSLIYQDIRDRVATMALLNGLPEQAALRISSERRVYQSIEEAIRVFVSSQPPVRLAGYTDEIDGADPASAGRLHVYPWPDAAAVSRADGGLTHVVLDGEAFIHFPSADIPPVQSRISSMYMQAANPLLFGDSTLNYAVDFASRRIYVIPGPNVKFRIIRQQTPFDYDDLPETVPIDPVYTDTLVLTAFEHLTRGVVPPAPERTPVEEKE